MDLVIKNGTLATASDVFKADIGIQNGVITALAQNLDGAEIIDATDKLVIPGGIDSHVHIAQPSGPGIEMADDFLTGTRSALMGGNTTIMPFCMQERGSSLRAALTDYHALAEGNCYTDVSFHLIISEPTQEVLGQELPAAVADGYTSFKVFMTYDMLRLNDAEILATMDTARRTGALVMVHCENEDAIKFLCERADAAGTLEPVQHARTRPVAVEREATHRAISLAEVVDVPLVVVHVSNGAALEEITRGRTRGRNIVGETCTQYLVLTADDLDLMDWEGAKYVCSPPPRDKTEQQNIWRGLINGEFELFSSDHCPFQFASDSGKLNPKGKTDFRHIPNGIPGVELRMPILFSEGVVKKRIPLTQFVALTSTNHAKTYGLTPQKGTLAIGADADITVWDPNVTWTVSRTELHDASDYSPYEGMTLTGRADTVVLGGNVMMKQRQLVGAKGTGRYLKRQLSERVATPPA